MRKQPDFTAIFFDHFGGTPRRVRYEVRPEPCRCHDLVFLSSLIHDARFRREDIRLKGKRLMIPLERDCWEIPLTPRSKPAPHEELHIARARLTISPVLRVEWTFAEGLEFLPQSELWIQYLWIDRMSFDEGRVGRVHLRGTDWKCILAVADDDLKIRLEDLEMPYLYSERNRAEP